MPQSDSQRLLAAALGKIPSGIFVLTARHEGAESGMLASWVQQCAFEPPHITVALKQGRLLSEWLTTGATFVVNLLDEDQTDMIGHFGRGFNAGEPAFEGLALMESATAPVLAEALAYLDCQVVSRHSAGDHEVYICQVLSGAVINEGRPMVHIRKSGFHY
jgi:flavin reductase (DIM6/NTAB) family NADH-FMN oxidoreductase RutF